MFTLNINNFQKITEASVKVKGFTIVRGESNLGKSSLARAVDSVVYGGFKGATDKKSGYLKKGAKECTIRMVHNTNDIKIVKSKSKNQYLVNGIELPKGGRGVPEQVRELGYEILANGVNLNIAKQHSPLFIIGDTETDITKSINSVFKVQLFEVAISKILKNKKETAIKETLLKEEVEKTKKHIAQLEELESLLETKQSMGRDIELLNQYSEDVTRLKQYTETNEMLKDVQSYIGNINIIDEYEVDTVELKILTEAVEPITTIITNLDELEQIENFLMDEDELIEAIETKDDLLETVKLLNDLEAIYNYQDDKTTLTTYKQDKSDTDISLLEITKTLKQHTCKCCNQIIYGEHR